ncbi:MAG: cobalamin biosynthesis protein [Alphaproteobacteria bacterium]|nr:cobalamin biosynthesis protein [Alphaproteobacteria bacterium]
MTGIFAERPTILLLLLAALVLDGLLPNMPWLFRAVPHPVTMIRSFTALLDRKLNRERRGEDTRLVRGLLLVVLVIALAGVLGWMLDTLFGRIPYGWVAEVALLVMLIAQRGVFDRTGRISRALKADRVAEARAEVRALVGRDADALDSYGVARAAIEACADTFAKSVVGPAFWYVLLGLPGLLMYVSVKSMDREIGFRSPRHAAFGLAAARIDDAAGYIPARIAGVLLSLAAAAVPTANPAAAIRAILRDAGKHPSPNDGWPEGALAGALDLALAGPRSYGGRKIDEPWLGTGRARTTAADVTRARYLFAVACLLHAGMIGGLALALDAI